MKDRPTDPVTELLLFAAARAEHMTSVIRPALDDGTWVISDRFIDSTRVYQGKLYGLERGFIEQLERFIVAPDYPDLTLILDLPVEAGLERLGEPAVGREDRHPRRLSFRQAGKERGGRKRLRLDRHGLP